MGRVLAGIERDAVEDRLVGGQRGGAGQDQRLRRRAVARHDAGAGGGGRQDVAVAPRTSAPPANVPPTIETVAPVRLRSSGSVTETAVDSVTAPPSSTKLAPAAQV